MGLQSSASLKRPPLSIPKYASRRAYVRKRLRELGLDEIEMIRSEAEHLPHVIREDEKIGGVLAGRSRIGHIMLVATDKRVIIVDCKPLFNDTEDIGYYVVAGVSVGNIGPFYTVTLHTRLGDFKIKTIYGRAAEQFKDYINRRCIEQNKESGYD